MASEFKLPELGENIASGTVAKVMVSVGDKVAKDQNIIELETDKAVVEVPSDLAGVVKSVNIKEGDEVKVGQTIIVVDDTAETSAESPAKEPREEPQEKPQPQTPSGGEREKKEEKKSDSGAKTTSGKTGRAVDMTLPELGENIDSGTVAKVLVSKGDKVDEGQGLVELETDKAVLEVPAETAGVIREIYVKEGEQLKVGGKVVTIVSEGAVSEEAHKEDKPAEEPSSEEQEAASAKPAKEAKTTSTPAASFEPAVPQKKTEPGAVAPAAPSVRRFAREIGIDIHQVPGSGPGGRISMEDVKAYAKVLNRQKAASTSVLRGIEPEPLPDFSKWGEVERQTMSNVRQKTAKHLGYAWATVAHVTQFDKADITDLEKFRKQYGKRAEAAGGKLTATAILLKICSAALKVFPQFNASIDMTRNEIIYKKYYNIGIAVDTDRGLLVPVIRDVNRKNIVELSVELSDIAEKARNKKLTLDDMQGGNFSISNLGGIGGTAFTPIVNTPEVAILGVSRSKMEPVYIDGQFEPRLMLPLSLSYDHRLIDGADAARFLRWIVDAIEQPFLLALEG